jgi:CoA:oxalate CoA-transferase
MTGEGPGGGDERPLAGVRILDFTRVLSGPYCTALLADLGADVLKVEPPHGDDYRHIGPFHRDGSSALFEAMNRGKRSVVLDLARDDPRRLAVSLAAGADVVVENFRPGVADRLGIGWPALSARNPALVYASISGFGQQGPLAARPAYDIVVQAMSGIMEVTGDPAGPPTLIGESIADVVSGLFERGRTGKGRHLDVAMLDSMLAVQPLVLTRALASGTPPRRVGNRHALSAPFGAFAASDGTFVLAVLNDKLFATLAGLLGQPEIAAEPRFATDAARLANEADLRRIIEAWAGRRTAAEAVAALVAAGVPAAEVMTTTAALASDHARARPVVQEVAHPALGALPVPEQPVRFAGAARGGATPAPRLGAHDDVLADPAGAWKDSR